MAQGLRDIKLNIIGRLPAPNCLPAEVARKPSVIKTGGFSFIGLNHLHPMLLNEECMFQKHFGSVRPPDNRDLKKVNHNYLVAKEAGRTFVDVCKWASCCHVEVSLSKYMTSTEYPYTL